MIFQIVLVKKTSGADAWTMLHTDFDLNKYLRLDTTSALVSDPCFQNTAPSTTVFTLDSDGQVNGNTQTFIAYCFAEKTGYSKFGEYKGNGNADGTFVYTGFKPAWVLGKRKDSTNNWYVFDTIRDSFNLTQRKLRPDTNAAENNNSSKAIDILSNGFKIRNSDAEFNASGGTYIYMAFGQSLVGSNNVPCTAR